MRELATGSDKEAFFIEIPPGIGDNSAVSNGEGVVLEDTLGAEVEFITIGVGHGFGVSHGIG